MPKGASAPVFEHPRAVAHPSAESRGCRKRSPSGFSFSLLFRYVASPNWPESGECQRPRSFPRRQAVIRPSREAATPCSSRLIEAQPCRQVGHPHRVARALPRSTDVGVERRRAIDRCPTLRGPAFTTTGSIAPSSQTIAPLEPLPPAPTPQERSARACTIPERDPRRAS